MTVVPIQTQLIETTGAISLARYAWLINYSECSFFGVNADVDQRACREIWLKRERDQIQKYLAEAQQEIEQIVCYPLNRRWFTDEQHPYLLPVEADWGKVVEGGIRATTTIQADAAVDHTTDPAVVGPIATTVTDESEIYVFYPASLGIEDEVEINPSDIDLDTGAGTVTIYLPRCRTVTPAQADNPRTGLDYTDLTNFLSVVDVVRVYNDPSTHADLVHPHGCTSCTCGETTQDGCITVRNGDLGVVDVLPATYSGGSWTRTSARCLCCTPQYVRLNYHAGLETLTRQAEDAIIRLAHAKMPAEPCACETTRYLWERDRETPEVLTRERLNCPFGLSNGAWIAWRFTQTMKLYRAAVL